MWLLIAGAFGGALLLDRLAAVEKATGNAATQLAGAALMAGGAYYLYRRAK
ncbi:MAG TPA: LPXTG cell wall anchor domain-containing protein [Nitrococcus sp.]|nr:LPXTG cell wall anchor domain-containing protein [Nitrococcus sp.]